MRTLLPLILFAPLAAACGPDDPDLEPAFPADYASTYVEVRDCRGSGDHDLLKVRVLADPAAAAPYLNRDADFPVGSVVLKAEYEFDDTDCSGTPTQWTVMVRKEPGSSPDTMDWTWQKVGADRAVESQDDTRCIGCHQECGIPPEGYLGTCTVP